MNRRQKAELFEQIRRGYEFGIGTIAGVARQLGVHRRMVRQAWREQVQKSGLRGSDRFLTTLDNGTDEITNDFHDRQTSGFVEGLNNKIKVLKRRCYGRLSVRRLFQRLFLDLEGYPLLGCP